MAPFIPPVTGTGGVASSVAANSFDNSGNFRDRSNSSLKRRRHDAWGSEGDNQQASFDIIRDYPPLVYPTAPKLDVTAIQLSGYDCFFNSETSNEGTSILIKNKLNYTIINKEGNLGGNFILLKIKIDNTILIIESVYGLNINENIGVYNERNNNLAGLACETFVLGGGLELHRQFSGHRLEH